MIVKRPSHIGGEHLAHADCVPKSLRPAQKAAWVPLPEHEPVHYGLHEWDCYYCDKTMSEADR